MTPASSMTFGPHHRDEPRLPIAGRGEGLSTIRTATSAGHARTTPNELLRVSRLELRRLAQRMAAVAGARGRGRTASLEPTSLVNEVARRLLGASGPQELTSRSDYYADLAQSFRRLLRERTARGLPADALVMLLALGLSAPPTVAAVDAALTELEEKSPRHAQIATLRLLAGMTDEEIADQMTLSAGRVAKGWDSARGWLERELGAASR